LVNRPWIDSEGQRVGNVDRWVGRVFGRLGRSRLRVDRDLLDRINRINAADGRFLENRIDVNDRLRRHLRFKLDGNRLRLRLGSRRRADRRSGPPAIRGSGLRRVADTVGC
jgi:hypothetical protein